MPLTLNSNKEFVVGLRDIIQKQLEETIEQKYEEIKKEFIEKVEYEKSRAIAATLINVMKVVDFQVFGDRIVITVNKQ